MNSPRCSPDANRSERAAAKAQFNFTLLTTSSNVSTFDGFIIMPREQPAATATAHRAPTWRTSVLSSRVDRAMPDNRSRCVSTKTLAMLPRSRREPYLRVWTVGGWEHPPAKSVLSEPRCPVADIVRRPAARWRFVTGPSQFKNGLLPLSHGLSRENHASCIRKFNSTAVGGRYKATGMEKLR